MNTMATAEIVVPDRSLSPEVQEPVVQSVSGKRKRGTKVLITAKDDSKKSKSKKRKTDDEDGLDIDSGINTAFENMNNQLVADHIAQKTRKYESDLSSIELEDKYIPGVYLQS
jgi:protein CMS1